MGVPAVHCCPQKACRHVLLRISRPDEVTDPIECLQLKRDAAILARKASAKQPDAAAQQAHLAAAEAGLRRAAAAEKARATARKAEQAAKAERVREAQRAQQQGDQGSGDRAQGKQYVGDDPFKYLPKGISIEDFHFD